MGFNTGQTYSMSVYFTDKGLEALYTGGLKEKLKYFALGSDEINYQNFSGSTYNYNQTSQGDYTLNGSSITIPNNYTLAPSGKVERNQIMNERQILKTPKTSIKDLLIYAPDAQTTLTYDLSSYKVSDDKKYFNLTSKGSIKKPIVLGRKNMYIGGGVSDKLYYLPRDTDINGYIDGREPVYGLIPAGISKEPYPGVSVTKELQSNTEEQSFFIYNRSRRSVFFESIKLKEIKPKTHRLKRTTVTTNDETGRTTIEYLIEWTALDGVDYEEGILTITVPSNLLSETRVLVLPFQNYEFTVKYEVVNVGIADIHYHGQTTSEPNKKEGLLSFSIEFTTFISIDGSNTNEIVSETVDIIVQTKDSGYDATSFNNANSMFNTSSSNIVSIGDTTNNQVNNIN